MGKTFGNLVFTFKEVDFPVETVGCGRVLRDARRWNYCLRAEMVLFSHSPFALLHCQTPFAALLPPVTSTRQITFLATAGGNAQKERWKGILANMATLYSVQTSCLGWEVTSSKKVLYERKCG